MLNNSIVNSFPIPEVFLLPSCKNIGLWSKLFLQYLSEMKHILILSASCSETRKKINFGSVIPYTSNRLLRKISSIRREKSLVFGEKNLNGSIKPLVAMVSTSHPVLDLLGVVNMLKISGFSLGGRSETVVFQSPPRITGVSLNLFKNSSILLKKDLLSSTLGP